MEDSDEIRGLVRLRLQQLKLEQAEVSRQLDKGRSYLNDYLGSKRMPRIMPDQTKIKLARIIHVHPSQLGVPPMVAIPQRGGFNDDAIPYEGGPFTPIPAPFTMMYRIKSRALDEYPDMDLRPGRVGIFNINASDPKQIPPGAVVIAQVFGRDDLLQHKETIVRQFFPPNKLVTNSSKENEIRVIDASFGDVIVVKGTLVYSMDVAENGNRMHEPEGSQPSGSGSV